jgi:hypothetical protein
MGVVSQEEQDRRGIGFAVVLLSALMAVPILGQIIAMFMAGYLALAIFMKSSSRLADFGILLAFTIVYLVAMYIAGVSVKSFWVLGIASFIISFIGLSTFQRKGIFN